MKTIVLDDEELSLRYLEQLCVQIPRIHLESSFLVAEEALKYVQTHPIDLVISDIEMPGYDGLVLTQKLKETAPHAQIIFVTGYEQYALKAFQLEAAGYLMKPCTKEELEGVVQRAFLFAERKTQVRVQTFGYFSVTVQGTPIRFANSKAKELLAMLIDRRGEVVTMEQAITLLWEDRSYNEQVKRLYRKAVAYLHQLDEELMMGIFVSNRGSCQVLADKVQCDYYELLKGHSSAVAKYQGEYLLDYSWGEATNGKIISLLEEWKLPWDNTITQG